MSRDGVLAEVSAERDRQELLHPAQVLPFGGHPTFHRSANAARRKCDYAAARGELTWRHVLLEEMFESIAETDLSLVRVELVQVAAVAVRIVEAIDSGQVVPSRKLTP